MLFPFPKLPSHWQVIATAPYNPMLVLVGVPAIPVMLVMLEGVDLDGRYNVLGNNIIPYSTGTIRQLIV